MGTETINSAGPEALGPNRAAYDPLRFCIFTTVAILAWAAGPPAVGLFSSLGLVAYLRAARQGLRGSRCFLRNVWLVTTYLGLAFLASGYFTVRMLWHALY